MEAFSTIGAYVEITLYTFFENRRYFAVNGFQFDNVLWRGET